LSYKATQQKTNPVRKSKEEIMAKKKSKKTVKKSAAKVTKKPAKTAKAKAVAPRRTVKKASATKAKGAPKVAVKTAVAAFAVGDSVPQFELPATGNKAVSLSDLRGKKVVLYFYPKDCTPGCTIEGHDFTRMHKDFSSVGAEVFGVSRDTIQLHEKFKANENYSIDLLSDTDEKVCNLFGVIKMKNMYGKQVRGVERSTFVIGADGRLAKEWRGVKVEGHAAEVLAFVKSLT
jgi:peroxiredoxin Q/BCP